MDEYRGSERRLRETEAGAVAAGRGGRTAGVHAYGRDLKSSRDLINIRV
jgi:hypothetical protein